jgi:hypothetical protein
MSLLWVGLYGYEYSVPVLNSPLINWYAFLLWSGGLLGLMRFHEFLRERLGRSPLIVLLTSIAYFTGLLLVEYLGYFVLNVRLLTNEGPLLFGLIHGTPALKAYYVTAGVVVVAYANLIGKVLNRVTPSVRMSLFSPGLDRGAGDELA